MPERIHALNPEARFIYILREPVARVYSSYWHDARAGGVNHPFMAAVERNPRYLRTSDYAGQIRNYLPYFGLERFLLVDFGDFKRDPAAVVERCCAFLGVSFDGLPTADGSGHRNRTYQLSGPARAIRTLCGSQANFERVSRMVRALIPGALVDGLRNALTRDIPPLDAAQGEQLARILAPRNRELQELTGFDVSAWNAR